MEYGDNHRYLMRTIASQSVMTLEDAKKLVEKKSGNKAINIQVMLKEINNNIKPLKQMIKIVSDELTPEQLVVFVSTGYDDTTKAQNVFSPIELEFFRLLMEQIMSIPTREITDITAINLVNNVKVNNRLLSKVDAQKLLDTWCRMRYLDHIDQNYVLGVRAIHEFESYFSKTIPDSANIKCYICTSIVLRGYNCPYCSKTIHSRCLDISLRKVQKWPCCKSVYVHSELQEYRRQRLETPLEATLQLEPTQPVNEGNGENTLVPGSCTEQEEMEISESRTQLRPRKRGRTMSSSDDDE